MSGESTYTGTEIDGQYEMLRERSLARCSPELSLTSQHAISVTPSRPLSRFRSYLTLSSSRGFLDTIGASPADIED